MPEVRHRVKFIRSIPQLDGEHYGHVVSKLMSPTGYIEVQIEGEDDIVQVHITDIEWLTK